MIVKVQLSVTTNDPKGPGMLVYNEDRSIQFTAALSELSPEVVETVEKGMPEGSPNKTYFWARMEGTLLHLEEPLLLEEWPEW